MGKHALVIDDSQVMRMIICDILESVGYQVTDAGDGDEGLEKLQEMGKVDLVLVDWRMPGMDGLEFIETVRKDQAYQDLQIIMITTHSESTKIAQAIQAGANDYVKKPFNKKALHEKLTALENDG